MSNQDGFEKWYDTYQRDGGELMLFNTLDLEAAYLAGCDSKDAEITKLREELDALNNQEPVGYLSPFAVRDLAKCHSAVIEPYSDDDFEPLYASPVPSIPEGYALVPVAWRVRPFEYGVGHEGAYALTMREDQVAAWKNKGWSVEALALISAAQEQSK